MRYRKKYRPLGLYNEARFIDQNKAEVSKGDYSKFSSKAKSCNDHYFAASIGTVHVQQLLKYGRTPRTVLCLCL
jgi:hypothetical protein